MIKQKSEVRTKGTYLNFIIFSSFRFVCDVNQACEAVDSRHKHAGVAVVDYYTYIKYVPFGSEQVVANIDKH